MRLLGRLGRIGLVWGALGLVACEALAVPRVLVVNRESIEEADPDGSGQTTFLSGLTNTRRIKVAGDHVYWVKTCCPSEIQRSSLTGTDVEQVVVTPGTAFAFDVDAAGGKVYYAVQSTIYRADLDGSNEESLLSVSINPGGMDLDVAAGKMYWTLVSTGLIQRANLDGSGLETLVSGLGSPNGFVLDVAGGRMYWTDLFGAPDVVRRANLDGSGVETIISGADAANADAIDVDPAAGRIYYLASTGELRRANLDGSGVELLLTTSDTDAYFRGVVLADLPPPGVPAAGPWALGALALALAAIGARRAYGTK